MTTPQSSLYTNGDVWSCLDDVTCPTQSSTTLVVQCNSLPRHKSPVIKSPPQKPDRQQTSIVQSHVNAVPHMFTNDFHDNVVDQWSESSIELDTSIVQCNVNSVPHMFTNDFHDSVADQCSESSIDLDNIVKANLGCTPSEVSFARNHHRRTRKKKINVPDCARNII